VAPLAVASQASSRSLDQFFTSTAVARACIAATLEAGRRWNAPTWLEPSAGQGVFLRQLPKPRIGLDIAPRDPEIQQCDFLDWVPEIDSGPILVVGNPPFGKNASLAVRFFNHSAKFAEMIAMIVPRTFQKASTHRKLDPHFHLLRELDVGTDAFIFDGLPYDVPTVFQIWLKSPRLRQDEKPLTRHPHFAFVAPDVADFAFQRVGARAGLVSTEGLQKSPQSHYFIASRTGSVDVRAVLSSIDWNPIKHRTAGNPSIGKSELVLAYAGCLE
jgi:hypothetical protein